MTLVSQAEFQAALRVDFYSFMLRCFAELNPGVPAKLAHRADGGEAAGGSRPAGAAAHRQYPASPTGSQIAATRSPAL